MRWANDVTLSPSPAPLNGTPWQARLLSGVLTERGLATLLTLVLVGAMLWGQYRLISDARDVGEKQIAQQERIIVRLDEALTHLQRIEALMARGVGGGP